MRKSKLDPYCDFIMARLPSKNVCQIANELAKAGCKVSPSTLTQWLKKLGMAEGIEIPQWERGRPKETLTAIFGFLPAEGEHNQELGEFPPFLIALWNASSFWEKLYRENALNNLGIPSDSNTSPLEWNEPDRFANLADLELCVIAFLRSDLPSPPLRGKVVEFEDWLTKLFDLACKLRKEIHQACKARKS